MFSLEQKRRDNPWLSLILNIVIPSLILMRLSGDDQLGAVNGLLLALAFPLGYGLYDLFRQRRVNLVSGLGIISVLLTGGIGLLQLDTFWIRVKEAGIPAILGIAVLISLRTPYPLARVLFGNILNKDVVSAALARQNTETGYNQLITRMTLMLAGSFFLSALLNYLLASWIVTSPSGTSAFNAELGRLTALSFPVIAVPLLIVLGAVIAYGTQHLKRLTGLQLVDMLKADITQQQKGQETQQSEAES